tara:strand:- start:659 stop:847 length:189 start_codon:yes stop_codon:yes gene_type:complete
MIPLVLPYEIEFFTINNKLGPGETAPRKQVTINCIQRNVLKNYSSIILINIFLFLYNNVVRE